MLIVVNTAPTDRDVEAIRKVCESAANTPFVLARIAANVVGEAPAFSRDRLWRFILDCLLSTRQRAGPNSRVRKFGQLDPHPLTLEKCLSTDPVELVRDTSTQFGGIRFIPSVASRAGKNLRWLQEQGWEQVHRHYSSLERQRSSVPKPEHVPAEREAARFISQKLEGFGMTQSRNLWQLLGLTRYEIPLDSRVIARINEQLSVEVTAKHLGSVQYYESVLDFLQTACRRADVLPCVLDAAWFSAGLSGGIPLVEAS
jgi:hypothetical protein